jgi:hypothetical protein
VILKGPFIEMFVQFLHIFLEKITLNELLLRNSQFWEMADFFQIGFRDIAMTCTNIVLGQTLLKLLKLLGPTHKYKRVHDLIV